MRLRLAVCFVFFIAFSWGAAAVRAEDGSALASSLNRFAADSFSETEAAIAEITASGAPTAPAILQAASDRRLFYSPSTKAVFYKDAAGKAFDAASGQPLDATPSDAKAVRFNNKLRGMLETALGALMLQSPDISKRLEAAASIFKSRDPKKLEAIDSALANERDGRVKQALQEAKAAIVLSTAADDKNLVLPAIAALRSRGDQDALALLRSLPETTPEDVRKAANSAIQSVETNVALWNVAQNLWYGLSLSSVLLLAAIGLAITFGVMGVINMAHGEMVMLGAYTTFVVQEVIRASAPHLFGYSLAFAIPMAFLVSGAVGVLIERTVIRFLYGRPLDTLLATWGVSLILQQLVRTIFGPTNQDVGAPPFMSGTFTVGQLAITWNRLWIIVFAGLIFTALLLALKYTSLGLQMRAVTQNRRMASSMGIRTGAVDAMTFGLGSAIAGLAGVALSQIDNVSPNLGQGYIVDSFLVVIFGGVGNLWGTLVGALTLGIANKFLEPTAGAVLGKIILIVLIILFIQKRPRGLFALKGRAIEA
ncbi:urea ABC transporter permease subunit UrtB [Hyphomicrobium sp.]|uniref:urea ABC transporter permease subunit UrtB n=1 Tax=Hyphomicrobium sp. TaxID=82 RepID=UPI002D79130C|nr:urea ABC transporter permease subunit UrtB [Hyphomicrobium sp.]HET6388393.1 urea ABC transporter permease subunit UrtB [Hyphomicrobium sp.]